MNPEEKRNAGRHEAQLREVNERTADALDEAEGSQRASIRVMCECSRGGCEEMLDVPRSAFERVRDQLTHFVVAPGHVLHEVEECVDRGEAWIMVRKRGDAAMGAVEEAMTS